MKTLFPLFLAMVFLAGCQQPDWRSAPNTYKCTIDEIKRVQDEADWCNENTSFRSSYCYGAAIVRICNPIGESEDCA